MKRIDILYREAYDSQILQNESMVIAVYQDIKFSFFYYSAQPSKSLKFESFREGCFMISNWMQVPLRPFVTISLRKINVNNLSEYDVPFSAQQYTHGSSKIYLFKYKSFDSSNPPESPQILDIYSVMLL